MRILVTGSSGFIGSHLTPLLAERGHEIVGFDTKEPTADYRLSKFVQGDIRKQEDVLAALDQIDGVINLAAVHFDYGHTDEEYWDTNENGSRSLLKAMTEARVERLLFTSSIAVYGDREDEASEDTTLTPTTVYGKSKLAAEVVVRLWSDESASRRAVIIRPCVVYGERNITNMHNLIRQIDSGAFILFGSGKNYKATAYVGNLVAAIVQQVESMEPGLTLFNYADKPDLTVQNVVAIIRTALGKNPRPLKFPLWLGVLAAIPFEAVARLTGKNLPVSIARVRKLAQPTQVAAAKIRAAGFEQPISSEEGLTRMVRHYKVQKRTPVGA